MAIFYSGSCYTDTSFCYNDAAFHLQSGKKNKNAFWLQHRYFHDCKSGEGGASITKWCAVSKRSLLEV